MRKDYGKEEGRNTGVPRKDVGEKSADRFAEDLAWRLIREIKKGTSPYQKPWGKAELPYNPVTGTRYRGANSLRLMLEGRNSSAWLTFRQAKMLGGHIKEHEHGVRCFFYARRIETVSEYEAAHGEGSAKGALKARGRDDLVQVFIPCPFTVFSVEQTEGLDLSKLPPPRNLFSPIDRADALIRNSGAVVENVQGDRCCYVPSEDRIVMPLKEQFRSNFDYYDTLLHELGHWTGSPKRLGRFQEGTEPVFGSEAYAKEELRAETASLLVASSIGLPHRMPQHATYIGAWINVLGRDPKELVRACEDAERISDYVLQFDRDRRYVLDYEKGTATAIGAPEWIALARSAIAEKHLASDTFENLLENARKNMIPDAEEKLAKRITDPETNRDVLLANGFMGCHVTKDPVELLAYEKAAPEIFHGNATSLVRRVFGREKLASFERELSSDAGFWKNEISENLGPWIRRFATDYREKNPDPKALFARAPEAQKEEIMREAGDRSMREVARVASKSAARAAERGTSPSGPGERAPEPEPGSVAKDTDERDCPAR